MPSLSEVIAKLRPTDPWGYMLYIIAFLAIITLALQKKSSLQLTIFLSVVVMSALIDKVFVFPQSQQFWAFFIRVLMFALPLVVAGMTRSPKSRGPAILAGVIGMVYLFARWFFEQRM